MTVLKWILETESQQYFLKWKKHCIICVKAEGKYSEGEHMTLKFSENNYTHPHVHAHAHTHTQ
jgi:hypothetical protein